MKILITGAMGLVGTAITRALIKSGHSLTALYRNNREEMEGVTWVYADLNEAHLLPGILCSLSSFDALIHNAALVDSGNSKETYENILNVNIQSTRHLFDWAETHVSDCILFTSSLSLLSKPLPAEVTEDSAIYCNSIYPMSKLIGEQLLQKLTSNKRKIAFRISSPVSDNIRLMPDTVVKKWIASAGQDGKINVYGKGGRRQNFVSTWDIARAVELALENKTANGIYNIASPNSISMNELAGVIATKYQAVINHTGTDPLENEVWNVSIGKAQRDFSYSPLFDSKKSIEHLLLSVS